MSKTIYFDMDGTIADFYSVEGWLEDLNNSNPRPYAIAKPLVNMSSLARKIHTLQTKGYKVGIVSWLSRTGTAEYNKTVTEIKQKWLSKHLPSVQFDEINIVQYGTPKSTVVKDKNGILFDDEKNNRKEWKGLSFNEEDILKILTIFTK